MSAAARLISDYDDLIDAIRVRVDELAISREGLDDLAGLTAGYSGKLLSPSRTKVFGRMSLGSTLGAIGCRLILVEDPAATAKTLSRRELVDRTQQRFGDYARGPKVGKQRAAPDANAAPKRRGRGKYD
jgi:hypothetical protein